MPPRFSNPDQLNTLGFSFTVVTLIAGLTAFVTDSLALTFVTLVAQLGAMACFTLGQQKS